MGTQKLKNYLEYTPDYIKHLLEPVLDVEWETVRMSRQTVNNILKKHKRNGGPYGEIIHCQYFGADYPDQLWQMDIRDPFTIGSERKCALIILDDHSRCLTLCTLHLNITVTDVLNKLYELPRKGRKPSKILVDPGPQFRDNL